MRFLRNLFASGDRTKTVVNTLITVVILVVVISGVVGFIDHGCSDREREVLNSFAHYGDRNPTSSTTEATGNCTLRYSTSGTEEEILGYYQKNLSEQGWSAEIQDAPALSELSEAERREATESGAEYSALDSLRAIREEHTYTVRLVYEQGGSSDTISEKKRVIVSLSEDSRFLDYFLNPLA